jgi:hypothetical protein
MPRAGWSALLVLLLVAAGEAQQVTPLSILTHARNRMQLFSSTVSARSR